MEIIRTPHRAPQANAFAERWVLTVRSECLDWILIRSRRHLERVLRDYVKHYARARPHRGLDLKTPSHVATQRSVEVRFDSNAATSSAG